MTLFFPVISFSPLLELNFDKNGGSSITFGYRLAFSAPLKKPFVTQPKNKCFNGSKFTRNEFSYDTGRKKSLGSGVQSHFPLWIALVPF